MIELIALWRKGQRPRLRELKRLQEIPMESPVDVSGSTCIHVNFKGEVCGEKVEGDRPHLWLCAHHDQVTRERMKEAA